MRKIIYQCDICKREYPYELKADEGERGVLANFKLLKVEVCRQCLKKIMEYIQTLK
jgi:hypothetical protein